MDSRLLFRAAWTLAALGLALMIGCGETTESKVPATEHPGSQGFFGKDGGPAAGPAGGAAPASSAPHAAAPK
jgi:hypothetical protein